MLFILPFALGFIALTGGLIYIGESMPLQMVVALQSGEERVLYRSQYGNRDLPYKLLMTAARQPDVLALGSSHVLQLREGLFNRDGVTFYNAGAPAWELAEVGTFLARLETQHPNALPDVLILALDHPWFNAGYSGKPLHFDEHDLDYALANNASFLQQVIRGVPLDVGLYLRRREPWHGGLALGMRAIRDGHGFRNDGSEQYGDFLVAHHLWPENERQRHLDLLRDGGEMYVYGDTVNADAVAAVESILGWAEARGVYVVGFAPPLMPTLHHRMMEGGRHTYVPQMVEQLDALFRRYGFTYFDFSDGSQLGGSQDSDFFDGWHGSERVHLHLYLAMLNALPDILSAYSDEDTLRTTAANAINTWDVFGP
jgi:hypothetical protein